MNPALGVIGCGNMGYALIKGIVNGHEPKYSNIYISDINTVRTDLFSHEFAALSGSNQETVASADIIFLAVKPGQIKKVLTDTRNQWKPNKLLISIAAGISTDIIENAIGIQIPVVRVMPNTPCLVAEGVSAICAGKYASAENLQLVEALLNNLGLAVIIEEKYMDAVTAVSGSGPGYAYLVAEAMMDAAVNMGLNGEMARKLVVNTIRGSMTMLQKTNEHPAVLKAQVSSPGGTTIAGLRQLEQNGIRKAFFDAVESAFERSVEQSKQ
ncbi:MAG TPA: pyrroline-5-carboxylate reductase [Syntrophomonadaceae bacterium]|nr:pyrroline-5-carboxylate reductase [Syntrophomonadaceae bacterium]